MTETRPPTTSADASSGLDRYDTSGCPRSNVCECCGQGGPLAVTAVEVDGGVACLTVCPRCASAPSLTAVLTAGTQARFVEQHRHHRLQAAAKAQPARPTQHR